ncbi:radical SAM protein [Agreia sp. VKM Ac-1783]|uniref:radical SAM protein n=1 Tax=Agreia sp. VKM Ac-1783 TaxID=1938889 RepID=UPI000A2AEA56|nr:radical SAM protein [Agreia sp. VKM Ac-1783]SMQ71919.1 radical SAM additional 4Fe4S-binding SPASM domain-containing protein [Agreia sp. VKM Ac-1783]
MKRSLIIDTQASSCYFRTSVEGDSRKALVQITERCNLHCAHCFVSSMKSGADMDVTDYELKVLPRLIAAGVERVTLTGGEPFVHPNILEFCRATIRAGLPVGICTNATQTTLAQMAELSEMGDVHINVSFDGFRSETHGKFRGDRSSFDLTEKTTRQFASFGLLQGLLSTPNALTDADEFADLCEFAAEIGAEYVLMNPLSAFGRGIKSKNRLEAGRERMRAIAKVTARFNTTSLELVQIRFPNDDLPLGGCDAGKFVYVFTDGETAVCPYLVFAARNPLSRHEANEFLVSNILEADVAEDLANYDFHSRYEVGNNETCRSCSLAGGCGKGCPAAVIADGYRIGAVDEEQCPVVGPRPLLALSVKV